MAGDLALALRIAAQVRGQQDVERLRREVQQVSASATKQLPDITATLRAGVSQTTLAVETLRGVLAATITLGGIGLALRAVIRAGVEIQRIQNALKAGTGSAQAAAAEFEFVSRAADRMGIEVLSAAQSYASLVNATRGTRVEGEATRQLFLGVTTAASALSLSEERVGRAFTALSQIAGKGVVSMEEIRGQLAEAIPGASHIAARALGLNIEQFNELVASGHLAADTLLNVLGPALQQEFGDAAADAADNAQAAFNRMSNAITELKNNLASAGLVDASASTARGLAGIAKEANKGVLGVRAIGIGVGFFQKSVKDLATGNFAALAGNLQALRDSLLFEAEDLGVIDNTGQEQANAAAAQARQERIQAEAAAKATLVALQKDLTTQLKTELQFQLGAFQDANKKLEGLLTERQAIADRFKATRDEIAAGPQEPAEERNVVDVINSIQRANAQLKGGLGREADPRAALASAEAARQQIEALAQSGQVSKQFLDSLTQQAAQAADQAAGALQQDQQAKVNDLQSKITQQIALINEVAKITPELLDEQVIADAEALRATLEEKLAKTPIVIPVDVAGAAKEVLKDAQGRARGGLISGPGTESSDSIFARLSSGEYVLRAAAVKRYGLGFIAAMNQLRLPVGRLPEFALGGLVPPAVPSLSLQAAAGAGGSPHSIVNLHIGGETFSGTFDVDVAAELKRAVSLAALKVGRRR